MPIRRSAERVAAALVNTSFTPVGSEADLIQGLTLYNVEDGKEG
jgi:hypothetical protein